MSGIISGTLQNTKDIKQSFLGVAYFLVGGDMLYRQEIMDE